MLNFVLEYNNLNNLLCVASLLIGCFGSNLSSPAATELKIKKN